MVLRWLDQWSTLMIVGGVRPVTHEMVIESLLKQELLMFDMVGSELVPAIDAAVPGLGTMLAKDPSRATGRPLRCSETEAARTVTVLGWLRFVQGQAPGLKRQALAGLLRGYPLQVAARILSPNKRLGLRAVKQMHERALAAILSGVCDSYGIEVHDEFGFKPS